MFDFAWIIIGSCVIFVIIKLFTMKGEPEIVEDKYEWLEVISYTAWKNVPQIWKEMLRRKRLETEFICRTGPSYLYMQLKSLEREKFVETRWVEIEINGRMFPRVEYRRISKRGRRNKNHPHHTVVTAS